MAGWGYNAHAIDHTHRPIMSFVASARFLIGAVANQLLPYQCLLCGKFCFNRGVCAACWAGRTNQRAAVSPLWSDITPCLAINNYAATAGGRHHHLRRFAPDLLIMIFRTLILRFKHADGLYLTPVFGRFLACHYAALRQPGNLVIPIPLHRHRYLARRYNQSAELARWLAPADDFALDIVLRRHHNKRQAGLNRAQRRKNVAGLFSGALEIRATFLANQ